MGKTKISLVGEDLPEKEQKKKEKREQKLKAKKAEEIIRAQNTSSDTDSASPEEEEKKTTTKSKYAQKQSGREKKKSKRYTTSLSEVDRGTTYPLDKAVIILKKFQPTKFDESIELHINTKEDKVSGSVSLPHGSGKTLRIKIADDKLLEEIEKGKIDFDVLVAKPEMMPKLAKVARVLGPKGLMPNPKAGTVTQDPEKTIDKLSKGGMNFRTEPKAPIMHLVVGKKSFNEKEISENVKAVISAIGPAKIKSATLTSSMNPGIHLDVEKC